MVGSWRVLIASLSPRVVQFKPEEWVALVTHKEKSQKSLPYIKRPKSSAQKLFIPCRTQTEPVNFRRKKLGQGRFQNAYPTLIGRLLQHVPHSIFVRHTPCRPAKANGIEIKTIVLQTHSTFTQFTRRDGGICDFLLFQAICKQKMSN